MLPNGMQRIAYKMLSALPSRMAAFASLVLAAWPAGDPESFKQWWNWIMTPEQIRCIAIAVIAIAILYWVMLWLLKPKEESSNKGNSYEQHHTGSGDNQMHF